MTTNKPKTVKEQLDALVAARLADPKVQAANKDIIRRAKLAGHIS